MPLIGTYILPHGALTLNPGKYPNYSGVAELNKACFHIANEIQTKNPDTIFLITPHGISLESSFGIYLNSNAKGSAEWKGSYSDYTVEAKIDTEISQALLAHLQKNGNKAEGIVAYAEDEALPLRWGEAVPLWFVSQAYANNSLVQNPLPKLVVVALPRKRNLNLVNDCKGEGDFNSNSNSCNNNASKGFVRQLFFGSVKDDGVEFVKECHKFGRHLGEFFNENKKKFVLVVSGDLAHKHVYPPLPQVQPELAFSEKINFNVDVNVNNNEHFSDNNNNNYNFYSKNDEDKFRKEFTKSEMNGYYSDTKNKNISDKLSNKCYFNKINNNNNYNNDESDENSLINLKKSASSSNENSNLINIKYNKNNNKVNNINNNFNNNSNNNQIKKQENEIADKKQQKESTIQSSSSTTKTLESLKLLGEDDADLLDLSIKEWILNPIINEQILIKALDYQKKFLSCGYFGFVVLLGFIKEFSDIFEEIKGEVLACCHPTYYGMMVAKLNLKEFSDYVLIKK